MGVKYFLRRSLQSVLTFVIGLFVTFALYRLVPGGPIEALQQRLIRQMQSQQGTVNTQRVNRLTEKISGINPDQPILPAFAEYVVNIVLYQDFGTSIAYQKPVFEVLFTAMPWSVFLSVYGLLLGYAATILVGTLMAWKEGTSVDSALTLFVLTMNSIPYYIGGLVMLVVLGFQWQLFPTGGRYPAGVTPGFNLPFMIGLVQHAALPILSQFIVGFAGGAIGMRGLAVRVVGADYLRSARLRGLGTNRILTRYITRNSVLPMYTGLMIGIAGIFSSSVIVERIFQYPGVGWYLFEALTLQDYPLVMGAFIFFSALTILGTLLADLTYSVVDPRAGTGADREAY
jgi:peptide/nickel transport system permease protein